MVNVWKELFETEVKLLFLDYKIVVVKLLFETEFSHYQSPKLLN